MYPLTSRPQSPIKLIVLSSIVLSLALAGLIMDASGVPHYAKAQDFDGDRQEWNDYESQDWEECCEEEYEYSKDSGLDTALLIISPFTTYFVLILIFSLMCLLSSAIPSPVWLKTPLIVLFGLATATTGIFLTRKCAIIFGMFFNESLNSVTNSREIIHVMPYFGGVLGITSLILGYSVISYLKVNLKIYQIDSRKLVGSAQTFLTLSLLAFLFSPMLPIAYVSADKDYEYYDEGEDAEGQYLNAAMVLYYDDVIENSDAYEGELEEMDSSIGNYALVDNLFFVLIWINLSIIMLMSFSVIPKAGIVFEHISQINILSVVLLILALIFTIIMYANLPDLLDDNALFSEDMYDSFYFHVNWILLICCILGIINWVVLLIASHIPWWASIVKSNKQLAINDFNHPVYQQNTIQQPVYQQQPVYEHQSVYEQQNQQPPRF